MPFRGKREDLEMIRLSEINQSANIDAFSHVRIWGSVLWNLRERREQWKRQE